MFLDDGYLLEMFTNLHYVDHCVHLDSGRSVSFKALSSSSTDPDLTGQIIWPGCNLLLSYMDKNMNLFENKKCIEVGAGIAVCALLIAKYCNQSNVVATDGTDIVVDLINENIKNEKCEGIISSDKLKWGKNETSAYVQLHGSFDLVFGSEIAYDENCIDALVETVSILLKPGGTFIVGHINRYQRVTDYLMKRLDDFNMKISEEHTWSSIMSYKMDMIEGSVYVINHKT